jgi:hypothetical protein
LLFVTRNYVPLWRWFDDFYRRAYARGDSDRVRLVQLYRRVWQIRETNPQEAFDLCNEGAELARQLNEPCWELFHEQWAANILLFYLVRAQEALDTTTKLVAKASQPRYVECPVRARVFITLIAVYRYIDSLSYETEIRDMIDYMEREIPLDADTHQRLQAYRAHLCVDLKEYEKAEEEALQYLQMSAGDSFREAHAYLLLTRILYLRGQDETALEYARLGEEKSQAAHTLGELVSALLWQSILLRRLNSEDEAQALFKRGMAQYATLGTARDEGYYNMLCRFYEAGKEYEKSLATRDEQIQKIRDGIGLDSTFEAHRKRCLVLKQLGQLSPADVAAAQDAAKSLKHPEKHLAKLSELEDDPFQMPLY